jgi:endonuclease YncB( thermonuclease family)
MEAEAMTRRRGLATRPFAMPGAPAVLLALLVVTAGDALAEIAGGASVIDGDTIEIRGERIRLFGIDAPVLSCACARTTMSSEWQTQQSQLKLLQYSKMAAINQKGRHRD